MQTGKVRLNLVSGEFHSFSECIPDLQFVFWGRPNLCCGVTPVCEQQSPSKTNFGFNDLRRVFTPLKCAATA